MVKRSGEYKVELDSGIEIAYETFGEENNSPLVLIMGLACQMVVWDEELCEQLVEQGFWVIRFDNRDCGKSTHFHSYGMPDFTTLFTVQSGERLQYAPYTLQAMAEDVVGLMDHLQIESANVAGISMGGMIAQVLATNHSNRVKTLTSIASSTGNPNLPPPTREASELLYSPLPTNWEGFLDGWMHMWRVFSGKSYPVEEDLARKWGKESYERGLDSNGVARQFAAIIASGNRKKVLASVNLPTLVIHGDADPLIPVEAGRDTANTIPNAKLEIIQGMGHAIPRALWPRLIELIVQHARV